MRLQLYLGCYWCPRQQRIARNERTTWKWCKVFEIEYLLLHWSVFCVLFRVFLVAKVFQEFQGEVENQGKMWDL